MEFLYTIDPAANEPIMLILGDIGTDVIGDKFCRELMFLDTLGKSKINVWIHSEGGYVTDAEKIIAAILKSKTPVDTHNIGLAASCAGPIFLAGRKRYMIDYAKFMMHPVTGGDMKAHKAFEDSTVVMLSSRTPLTEDTIRRMMNETTWLTAKQCCDLGLCEIDDAKEFNKPRKAAELMNYADYTPIINKVIQEKKNKPMIKVTNKLKLNDSASEDAILSAIETIENRASVAESKLSTQEVENKAKLEVLNKQITELTEAKNKLEADKKVADEKAETEKKEANIKKAKESVANNVKLGKIKNDAKLIEAEEKSAIADLATFEARMEATPVNKTAPSITNKGNEEGSVPYSAAGIMAKLAIKNKQV